MTTTLTSPAPEVVDFLTAGIARFTRQDPAAIRPDSALVDLGLQSIDAVLLSGEVEDHFGIELDPATIFEHDTLASFASDITARLETR
ncbi:acyl carrier protein [Rhodovulum sulfidophilum]|uniref:phosphopantetheine-binding protein n=1 Tax=Rhodovulum sulfidophilum TaxID=35806 RepID=UPI001922D113|nr:acyl carrier protein [Rhodovulum sulfidophilum]